MFELKNKVNTATKFGSSARADQNTGGALVEFSVRTAVHGTSLV